MVERRYYIGAKDIGDKENDADYDPTQDDEQEHRDETDKIWWYPWLTDDIQATLNILFAQVSDAFDRKFYIAGKCQTRKNSIYGYTTEEINEGKAPRLARHNILHVRLCIAQIPFAIVPDFGVWQTLRGVRGSI